MSFPRERAPVASADLRLGPAAISAGALPLVSVVVPMFNSEAWIAETVSSVLSQSYDHRRIELVIVDDGSSDSSVATARQALEASDLAHRFVFSPNLGPSSARNLGVRAALGEWIQFLDSDDLLHPRKLEYQVAAAAAAAADVASIYSPWQRLVWRDGSWGRGGEVVCPRLGDAPAVSLLREDNFMHLGSQIIRKTWLALAGGFDEHHRLVEDVELLVRIAFAGGRFHLQHTDEPTFFYRQRVGMSLSHTSEERFVRACVRNARAVERGCTREGALQAEACKVLADIYAYAARHYASRNRRRFRLMVRNIERVSPGYVPSPPSRLRVLSVLVGYGRAALVGALFRRVRARMLRKSPVGTGSGS